MGILTTKLFVVEGELLEINVDAKGGTILVEVLDENGLVIPGYSSGDAISYRDFDGLRVRPQWKENKDLSSLRKRAIRLKFYLQGATLYAFHLK